MIFRMSNYLRIGLVYLCSIRLFGRMLRGYVGCVKVRGVGVSGRCLWASSSCDTFLSFVCELGKTERSIAMTPLQSWVDSLSMFRPSALKLFSLVTLRSIGQVYRVLLKASWPFYIFWWSILSFCFFTTCINMQVVFAGLYAAFFFVAAAATRPSVEQKNWRYIVYTAVHRWYVLALLIVLSVPFAGLPVVRATAFGVVSIWALFALDAHKNIRGFVWSLRSVAMYTVYNLPLVGIASVIHFLGMWGTQFLAKLFSLVGLPLGSIVIGKGSAPWVMLGGLWLSTWLPIVWLSLWAVLICNLYIKRVHEQPSLYH